MYYLRLIRLPFDDSLDLVQNVRSCTRHQLQVSRGAEFSILTSILQDVHQLASLHHIKQTIIKRPCFLASKNIRRRKPRKNNFLSINLFSVLKNIKARAAGVVFTYITVTWHAAEGPGGCHSHLHGDSIRQTAGDNGGGTAVASIAQSTQGQQDLTSVQLISLGICQAHSEPLTFKTRSKLFKISHIFPLR